MRVAILCNNLSSQKSARMELVSKLKSCFERVYIGGIYDGIVHPWFSEDTAVFLPIKASRNNLNPFVEITSILSVRDAVKKKNIDKVIIYGVKNHAAMAIGAKLGGAKGILCVVNGSGNLFRITGVKGSVVRFMAFPMLRLAYRGCSAICFQNPDDLNLFIDKKIIKKSDNTFVTNGSGVNLESFPFSGMPEENRFLFLSRITATKGIIEFCEAANIVKRRYKDAAFDIVGPLDATVENGKIKEILDKSVKEGIVKYHGYTDQVLSWMSKCRFFVYPSYYPEGVPRCVLQALSAGRPIITCNTPGCKETVKEGYNGFLVNPRDAVGISEKMIWMIEHRDEAEHMGRHSRNLAVSRFDVNTVNSEILQYLLKG